MHQSYLFQLVKSLSPEELSKVFLFIESPLYNSGKMRANMRPLLAIIAETVSTGAELNKKELFARLFPGKKESEGMLENNMAVLSKLTRTFLQTNNYWKAENTFYQDLDWAVMLRDRHMHTRYLQTIHRLRQVQALEQYQNAEYYLKQFLLEDEEHFWECLHNQAKGDQNLPATLKSLEIFYQLNQLELINRLMLQQRITQVDITEKDYAINKEIIIPEWLLQQSILLQINFRIYQLLKSTQPAIQDFYALEDLIRKHEKNLEPDVCQEFYAYLRNISTILLNLGYSEMVSVLFKLQIECLEKGYFYINGKISHGAFGNIVRSALTHEAYAWALEFMEAHKNRILGEDDTTDFYNLTMATYFFVLGDFDKALDFIPAAPKDTLYLFRARRLKLKVYYEVNSELLFYELDAFKMMLSRASKKLLSPQLKDANASFVNILRQIIYAKPNSKVQFQQIYKRLSSRSMVGEKDWLLEKIRSKMEDKR